MSSKNDNDSVRNDDARGNEVSGFDITLVVVALALSIFIIAVNSLTIFVIRATRRLQTLSNIYVMSLAVSDLIVGLGLVPLSAFYVPYVRKNYYDQNVNFCVFVLGINLGVAVISSLHMSLIATDRYIYIIWPYTYQKYVDQRAIYITLSCTWTFGVLYALLPQLIHNDASTVAKCDITLAMPVGYLFYSTSFLYGFCVVVDLVMYMQILYAAHRQRRVILSASSAPPSGYTNESFSVSLTGTSLSDTAQPRDKNGLRRISVEPFQHPTQDCHPNPRSWNKNFPVSSRKDTSYLKSVKFFMTVFGVYFICLTPTVVCMGVDYYKRVPRILYNMFNLLALLNSGMNFIIFFILNAKFRMSVLSLFRCRRVVNNASATHESHGDSR